MKRLLPAVLLIGTFSLVAIHAQAQNHDNMDGWGGMGHHVSAEKMEKMHAQHATELKQKLQITPAQEGAWTAFNAALKPNLNQLQRPDRQAFDALTTPERIEKMRALRKAHEAQIDQRDEAIKTFYVALTPAQQKIFDAEFMRHHHERQGDKKDAGQVTK